MNDWGGLSNSPVTQEKFQLAPFIDYKLFIDVSSNLQRSKRFPLLKILTIAILIFLCCAKNNTKQLQLSWTMELSFSPKTSKKQSRCSNMSWCRFEPTAGFSNLIKKFGNQIPVGNVNWLWYHQLPRYLSQCKVWGIKRTVVSSEPWQS